MEKIKSKVFGETVLLDPTDVDYERLEDSINLYPVNAFGILSKMLNQRGFIIGLDVLKPMERK